ncbi:uncharacterized protein [Lolium perenne]|uniref:uncharacterized protein n=1 Tax=Lolium perenne TaxID=4522 RepID=UPI0021F670D7|nr:uncharacterized protein LOC127346615 [Lolium perenne]
MDLRSGRRLGSRPLLQQREQRRRRGPGGADRISFLSNDMILLILARLHCVGTAVRTGVLSRRWRGLWTLLSDLAFRGIYPTTIEAAFSSFNATSSAGAVSQLDIHLPTRPEAADANSLLRAAALFSPARLVFTIAPAYVSEPGQHYTSSIHLPCFQHTTSIELDAQRFTVEPLAAGEFPALERLSISGTIVYIGDLVTRCPRLRVLKAKLRGLGHLLLKQELGSLKDALGSRGVALYLDICIYVRTPTVSLLSEAADLSPQELVYTNTCSTHVWAQTRNLPCIPRATSIEIDMAAISFRRPSHGELSALERLCLSRCNILNLAELVSCCPRLRVLRVDGDTSRRDITVHSTSLQELVLGTYQDCRGVNVVTPELKQLTLDVRSDQDLGTSVLAPLLENISWQRSYTWPAHVFNFWFLESMSLQTAAINGKDGAWLSAQQLPRTHVLSMAMRASVSSRSLLVQLTNFISYLVNWWSYALGILLSRVPGLQDSTLRER